MKPQAIKIPFFQKNRKGGKALSGSTPQRCAALCLGSTFSSTSGCFKYEGAGLWPWGHGQAEGYVTEDKDSSLSLGPAS